MRQNIKPFNCGDLVWRYLPGDKSRKFHHPWKGPFKVVKRAAEGVYKYDSLRGLKRFDRQCAHFTGSN